jgi:hypothetical protein
MNADAAMTGIPVFLTGYPKSGTTLLLSLLDGHPALNVFPRETLFFTRALPELQADRDRGLDRFVERIFKEVLFGMGDVLEDHIGADRYAAELRRKWESTGFDIRRFLDIAVETYGDLIDRSNRHFWVEKTPHTELFVPILHGWYPQARTIHCIRDPRANYSALLAWNEREGRSTSVPRFVSHWSSSCRAVERNQTILPQLVLRYEDLVTDTRSSMECICEFLGIEFDESLLQPTLEGRPFRGNSMFRKELSGVSRASLDHWKSFLTEDQISEIERLTRRERAQMNYEPLEDGRAGIATYRSFRLLLAFKLYQVYDRLPKPWRLACRKLRARVFGVGSY